MNECQFGPHEENALCTRCGFGVSPEVMKVTRLREARRAAESREDTEEQS